MHAAGCMEACMGDLSLLHVKPKVSPPFSSTTDMGMPISTLNWLTSTRPCGLLGRRRPNRSPSVPPAGSRQAACEGGG